MVRPFKKEGGRRDRKEENIDSERRRFLKYLGIGAYFYARLFLRYPLWVGSFELTKAFKRQIKERGVPYDASEKTNIEGLDWKNFKGYRSFLFGDRVLNLGVIHARSLLSEYMPFFRKAVQENDIVALEGEEGRFFFQEIGEMVLGRGKKLVYIDTGRSFSQTLGITMQIITLAYSLDIFFDFFNKEKREKWLEDTRSSLKESLKRDAELLGVSQFNIVPPSLLTSTYVSDKSQYPLRFDISYTGDARTVFMLANLKRLAKSNPDKKIVVITGEAHARGFDFYLQHPHLFEYKAKLLLYNLVYILHKNLP